MKVDIQILGCGSGDLSPGAVIVTDNHRYLFNSGDGTQRFCMEHRVRLTKLRSIFLTKLAPDGIGGLPGMMLTLADTGKSGFEIVGPPGLQNFVHATRSFVRRPDFRCILRECNPSVEGEVETFQVEELEITPIVIPSEDFAYDNRLITKRGKHEGSCLPRADSRSPRSLSEKTVAHVSYICKLPDTPGKLLVEKAKALGVPKGPLLGKLHRGLDVELPDGRVVRSEDCVGPKSIGPVIAVIDCPTAYHFQSLCSHPAFDKIESVSVMVHFSPLHIVQLPEYMRWMKQFGDKTEHILANVPHDRFSAFRASTTAVCRLSLVNDAIFSPIYGERQAEGDHSFPDLGAELSSNCTIGEYLLSYSLIPANKQGFDRSQMLQRLDFSAIQEDLKSIPGLEESIEMYKKNVHELKDTSIRHDKAEIVFLGTGSAIPSKYRNVTSMLLRVAKNERSAEKINILLDCGEGTLGQLWRKYGPSAYDLVNELDLIWISHMHADHHLGILKVLETRTSENPITIIAPKDFEQWLDEYYEIGHSHAKYVYFNNDYFKFCQPEPEENQHKDHQVANMLESLSLKRIVTVPVEHCPDAYALVLETVYSMKVVFSGDCRPSRDLAIAGKDAAILIHEATFEDELAKEAVDKRHSTVSEAVSVGREMGASAIFLTHFSQRYPKAVPPTSAAQSDARKPTDLKNCDLTAETTSTSRDDSFVDGTDDSMNNPVVCLAADLMTASVPSGLLNVPLMNPILELLYAEEDATKANA